MIVKREVIEEINDRLKIERVTNKHYTGYIITTDYTLSLLDCEGSKLTTMLENKEDVLLGVNGGGFTKVSRGKEHIGIKVKDYKIYEGKKESIGFIGIDKNSKLYIGNYTKEEIQKLGIKEGVSFRPILVSKGKRQTIVKDKGVKFGRTARTSIGVKENGKIVIIVIEGSKFNPKRGVTLKELQDMMVSEDIIDAINLDGGSSSILIYKGKLMNSIEGKIESKINNALLINKRWL